MKTSRAKTRKGAASIYIVIFTTTLLGIIALSFVRIMLAESLRTTNYSLSQSAYNSALAGVEDAKIVLLRYQNCINKASYNSASGKTNNCKAYYDLFTGYDQAYKTSQDCGVVGRLLHGNHSTDVETLIQTRDGSDTGTVDQAYTCVKIAAYTEDFLATLNSKNPTKLIPLRSDSPEEQAKINRIQVQWFDDDNYSDVIDSNGNVKSSYTGFWKDGNKGELTGTLKNNKGNYNSANSASAFGNSFTDKSLVPPVVQVTMIQSADIFNMNQFYASAGPNGSSQTNRGTLMLRPTRSTSVDLRNSRQISDSGNHSNVLPRNSLAYSANKSFNTPLDVICNPGEQSWGTYACKADFFIPAPIGVGYTDGSNNTAKERNMSTSFLVVNLPYGGPETDISVKMYHCEDPTAPISSKTSSGGPNCRIVYFANVQPMVDSTGRANDLFRRVESRIELADTNFPISSYALAMTDPTNEAGIAKDFYVTKGCHWNDTYWNGSSVVARSEDCANSKKNDINTEGKGNGE